MEQLNDVMVMRRRDEAWTELRAQARNVTDYGAFMALCRRRARLLAEAPPTVIPKVVRVALLGGATTETLEAPLALALDAIGMQAEIHRSPYGTFAPEMLEATSATAAFKPEVTVVVTTPFNLSRWPGPEDDAERAEALAASVADEWLHLCARLHEHTGSEIILNNFHPLVTRPLGNLGPKLPGEANNFLRRVNRELASRAPAFVHINDVDGLASYYGVRQWFDQRYWFHAKQPVSFACLVPYVRNTARIIGALFGVTAKCLVVDLDNTLWGGVVGDDGPHGIAIGEGDAVGEAFKAFQEYVRALKQRGVLLAVCSKNDEANALAPFTERPEMVLAREDFVAFKANWQPKPDNLREIAAELNIGLGALVFVDDNPAEREHVRQQLPEVKVIELSADPADYPGLVDQAGLFEITALSAEDRLRTGQYHANRERAELSAATAGDYASYLRTLAQRAVIRPFDAAHLDRVTQLVNKSNQFNLTTPRLSRSQVEERMGEAGAFTAYVRLADRFGDNGLISVIAARPEADALAVDLWLMSCRVLKRGVESLVCNYLAVAARAMGLAALHGVYRPTAKNGLVRDHYRALGFRPLGEGADGATRWRLDLDAFTPLDVQIDTVEDY